MSTMARREFLVRACGRGRRRCRSLEPDFGSARSWLPPVSTPPFPEYPSGHSVQSGAAFQVLTDMFGDGYAFVEHTHDSRGLAPRSFGSFLGAADEAAISRLYGGIHFRRRSSTASPRAARSVAP